MLAQGCSRSLSAKPQSCDPFSPPPFLEGDARKEFVVLQINLICRLCALDSVSVSDDESEDEPDDVSWAWAASLVAAWFG